MAHIAPKENVLEVNPIDLLAIEVLRTFDHETYLAVRDALGFSARGTLMRLLMGDEERKEQIKLEIDTIVSREHLTAPEKERLGGLLRRLFPQDQFSDARFMSNADRDLRICHPNHFTKYFEHALDETPTSAANIHALLGLLANRNEFAARLSARCQDGTLEDVFEKLELYLQEIPAEATAGFVGGLCDVGDELPEERLDMFNQDPIFEAVRMSYLLLRKLPQAERARLLHECFQSSRGVVFLVVMVALLEPSPDKKQDREPQLISDAELDALRRIAVERVAAFATSGAIWSSRHFAKLLYRWRDWTNQPTVNAWLSNQLVTPQRHLDLVVKLLERSIINGERIEHQLDGKTLEQFVPLERLHEAIGKIQVDPQDRKASEAVKLIGRALTKKQAGQPYSDVKLRGDFDPE